MHSIRFQSLILFVTYLLNVNSLDSKKYCQMTLTLLTKKKKTRVIFCKIIIFAKLFVNII